VELRNVEYDGLVRRRQHGCPAFARSCPKIPFFGPAVDTAQGLISVSGAGEWGDCHMTVKASGRSALILATGLFVCFAGLSPVMAASTDRATATSKSDSATSGKSVRKSARHWKRYTRRSGKVASKSTDIKKAAEKDVADASAGNTLAIPASVANANAQLASADAAPGSAQAMTAKANLLLASADKPAESQPATDAVVSSDQLNDLDRALQQKPATQTVAMAAAQSAPAAPVLASSNESSTWDQTSLIGKIFIAFGALLTMASAARMFMA
jgi:predicted nicotinamide N-methyase